MLQRLRLLWVHASSSSSSSRMLLLRCLTAAVAWCMSWWRLVRWTGARLRLQSDQQQQQQQQQLLLLLLEEEEEEEEVAQGMSSSVWVGAICAYTRLDGGGWRPSPTSVYGNSSLFFSHAAKRQL